MAFSYPATVVAFSFKRARDRVSVADAGNVDPLFRISLPGPPVLQLAITKSSLQVTYCSDSHSLLELILCNHYKMDCYNEITTID